MNSNNTRQRTSDDDTATRMNSNNTRQRTSDDDTATRGLRIVLQQNDLSHRTEVCEALQQQATSKDFALSRPGVAGGTKLDGCETKTHACSDAYDGPCAETRAAPRKSTRKRRLRDDQ